MYGRFSMPNQYMIPPSPVVWVFALLALKETARFLVPWHRLCRNKRKSLDGESEKLGDLTSWVDGDVEARNSSFFGAFLQVVRYGSICRL